MVLDGLGDGLIVVSGDNEEGKSTVLAALKAAFFEHHAAGGAVREAMSPHRGGVPEITVEFECAGRLFRLRKAFRRAGVVLETDGQRLQDDAAERRCRSCCASSAAGADARPENAGVQALFWVDQATAFRDFESIAGGHDRLTAAIAAEIGTVAGGEGGRRLLALARERAASFYTVGRQQEDRGSQGGGRAAACARSRAHRRSMPGAASSKPGSTGSPASVTSAAGCRSRIRPAGARAHRRRPPRLAELADLEQRSALAAEA